MLIRLGMVPTRDRVGCICFTGKHLLPQLGFGPLLWHRDRFIHSFLPYSCRKGMRVIGGILAFLNVFVQLGPAA